VSANTCNLCCHLTKGPFTPDPTRRRAVPYPVWKNLKQSSLHAKLIVFWNEVIYNKWTLLLQHFCIFKLNTNDCHIKYTRSVGIIKDADKLKAFTVWHNAAKTTRSLYIGQQLVLYLALLSCSLCSVKLHACCTIVCWANKEGRKEGETCSRNENTIDRFSSICYIVFTASCMLHLVRTRL